MALKDAPRIEVLKFDEKEAYNHDRPISSLIRTQLLHMHLAENLGVVPAKARTNININHLLTERQASEYLQEVTALLHRYGKASSRSKPKKETKSPAKTGRTSGKKVSGTQSKQKKVTTTKARSSRK